MTQVIRGENRKARSDGRYATVIIDSNFLYLQCSRIGNLPVTWLVVCMNEVGQMPIAPHHLGRWGRERRNLPNDEGGEKMVITVWLYVSRILEHLLLQWDCRLVIESVCSKYPKLMHKISTYPSPFQRLEERSFVFANLVLRRKNTPFHAGTGWRLAIGR